MALRAASTGILGSFNLVLDSYTLKYSHMQVFLEVLWICHTI